MLKFLPAILAAVAALLAPAVHAGEDAAALIARAKAASGGARWDTVRTLEIRGRAQAGGLDGEYRSLVDLAGLRTRDEYTLGPIRGADGYDGEQGWSRDLGGEISVLDAAEARRRARSQAWVEARGYWFPERHPARYGAVLARELDGRRYATLEATPEGGAPLVLWFDAATHRLARSVLPQGQDTAVIAYDDWREIDGRTLPFHSVTDTADAAGRTDPRRRSEAWVERVAFNVAVADADFAAPEMLATARIEDASGVTRIRFELINNHIYVDGAIDGKPARFLVDTGGVNLLTPAAARRFGLAPEGRLAARGVGEQEVDLALAHAKEVRVGTAVLEQPLFYVIDLGDLPAVEGTRADGLVGYEMFRRFGVTIDYAGQVLVLAEPAKFQPPAGAHRLAFEQAERIPVVRARLDGLPIRASIDTGSRASLTLHSPFVREHGLVRRYGADTEAVVGWGVGGPNRGRPARLGTLQLAGFDIDGIAGDLYTGDKGSFASPDLSANLGGGVLKRFTVAFDYAAKAMYLAPNAAFGRPDPFDRSGLWLLQEGEALRIADVAPDSAAARAGLRIDDRLTRIGDATVAARRLDAWRALLRELPAGDEVEVSYRRDGALRKATLRLADRIAPAWPAAAAR